MATPYNNYPPYNFSITGVASPSAFNTDFQYGYQYNDKPGYYNGLGNSYLEVKYDGSNWLLYNSAVNYTFVSSTTGVDYPWNVTTWLPITANVPDADPGTLSFNLVPFITNDIIVSGIDPLSGHTDLNGLYQLGLIEQVSNGLYSNRPVYFKTNGSESTNDWDWVYWSGNSWYIYSNDNDLGNDEFESLSNVYYPWEATGWNRGVGNYTGTLVIIQVTPVLRRNAKYATATEDGTHRFRRLLSLGYV